MAAWQLTKALWKTDVEDLEHFEVTQPEFNTADHPEEFLDVCADQGLAVCPYSPLEGRFSPENTTKTPPGDRVRISKTGVGIFGAPT